ncbi:predicted protein [Plenodomus lingam JN3]|uniref:Predicted protein n=1 Tax=Leptosphaeria maculans (strain JN3 / isolate v23.1.3 / race Av1-4-5-6-7-8) TaxID=985895 RepID=E4ZT11_LEPMJ|nr:predicted protein [Plenodomus lingam JN3]CBX94599.1 predicted protein [Plenodomus lingam JN3]
MPKRGILLDKHGSQRIYNAAVQDRMVGCSAVPVLPWEEECAL